jgi:uncharacterized protein YggE
MSFKHVLVFLGVVVVVLVLWQLISSPMIVTVAGKGSVSVPATSATVTATISVNSDSAQNAIAAVKSRASSIKTVLVGNGIAESNISESQITSYPAGLATQGASGYQAAMQIVAKTVHVSTVDDLVSSLYSSGATLVSQPVLSVENQSSLEQSATDAAIKDAKSQIGKIALKNLKLIRKAVVLDEQTSSTTSTTTSKADAVTGSLNDVAAQNGVFQIIKTVTISYKLW